MHPNRRLSRPRQRAALPAFAMPVVDKTGLSNEAPDASAVLPD
jgi:hypothetical protein